MYSVRHLNDIVNKSFLTINLNKEPPNLYDPIAYILNIGGKRIRPILTLAGCNVFSDNIDEAIKPAIAVEIFHNFTLIHDDIMDNAELRRGKETIHKQWNDNVAILSGDAMTIIAYQLLSRVNYKHLPRVLNIFNSFALGICEGQQYDMDFEKRGAITRDEYLQMIELKTAILLKGALQIGAVIGGASDENIDRIGEFGRCLGLAFQLQDDFLDTYGNSEIFGKTIGGDIVAGKKTILTVEAIEGLDNNDVLEFQKVLSDKSTEKDKKISAVKGYYEDVNAKSKVENLIEQYFSQAMEWLDSISEAKERKVILEKLSQNLMKREN